MWWLDAVNCLQWGLFMIEEAPVVDLGFVAARVPHGSHICQVYGTDSERDLALLRFVARGLAAGEATACFSDVFDTGECAPWFSNEGISLEAERQGGRFFSSGAEAMYFKDGYFDPERMYSAIIDFHNHSVATGCTGARLIGEMSPAITQIEGGSRLFEYEARVNWVLLDHPVTAVCQYDARAFSGATIMEVLSVHPMMVVRGSVVRNPFYVSPEEYLS